MIQAKNITKIYKPKKGQHVAALNGVSLTLPDRGMVFVLGKSGSGKSTLLNLLGGLDRPTSGEILVNGESILKSNNSRLDSYRNTYVGFIFQEYNLLPEFTVGANVALAIELQGRRAAESEINEILHEVDLDGYGSRRTNELSGGQLQRVAIARALVKKPDIIMADEPTGALDSVTGKAVFDTLKKLSRDKLVLIVSHDREFSERYADRIISLADGKIIGDDELVHDESAEGRKPEYGDDGVSVPAGYVLTAEDLAMINEYLRGMESGSYRVSAASSGRKFRPSVEKEEVSEKGFKLIRSRLPLGKAARIGAYSMRIKPFRLVMTILLSVVAFTLFGLSFAMASYDKISTGAVSISDAGIGYAAFTKEKRNTDDEDVSGDIFWSEIQSGMTKTDITKLAEKTGITLMGVFNDGAYYKIASMGDLNPGGGMYYVEQYTKHLTGFCGLTEEQINDMGYRFIAGGYPENDGEAAIPKYIAESFMAYGYNEDDKPTVKPESIDELIGKTLTVVGGEKRFDFRICGIIDTNFDSSRFNVLSDDGKGMTEKDQIEIFIRLLQLQYAQDYSLCSVCFCRPGFVDACFGESKTLRTVEGYVYMTRADGKAGLTLSRIDKRSVLGEGDYISFGNGDGGCVIDIGLLLYLVDSEAAYEVSTQWDGIQKLIDSVSEEELERMISGLVELLKSSGNIADVGVTLEIYDNNGGSRTINSKIDGIVLSSGETVYFVDDVYNAIPSNERGYAFAVGVMPSSRSDVTSLLKLTYNEKGEYRYALKNEVTEIIGNLDDIFTALASVFVSVGIVFAIFASLLFSNFIAQSILHKKMQIGILRAIGARSLDVFSIFFSESFFIAMINLALSFLSTFLISVSINSTVRNEYGFAVTVLPVGFNTALVLFLISVGVAFIASFLPVWKIARKKPVDAIRNR